MEEFIGGNFAGNKMSKIKRYLPFVPGLFRSLVDVLPWFWVKRSIFMYVVHTKNSKFWPTTYLNIDLLAQNIVCYNSNTLGIKGTNRIETIYVQTVEFRYFE